MTNSTGQQLLFATGLFIHKPGADFDGDGPRLKQLHAGEREQCDSDGDGYGNRCDGDMNNTTTNAQDYVLFRQQLGQPSVGPTYNKAALL